LGPSPQQEFYTKVRGEPLADLLKGSEDRRTNEQRRPLFMSIGGWRND
jgi:hypothetical protein